MVRPYHLALLLVLMLLVPLFAVACSDSDKNDEATPTSGARTSALAPAQGAPGAPPAVAPQPSAVDVAAKVVPAVVRVGVNCSGGDPSECAGTGSGWLYDDSGHFVTNNHVVTLEGQVPAPSNLVLTTAAGVNLEANLVGADPRTDLAVVSAQPPDGMEPLAVGDTASAQIGEPVIAIGYALDLGTTPSVTTGVISAKERQILEPQVSIYGLLQTDAAINPGNSGGPLVNYSGEVLGVNTAGIMGAQGIGFAVSSRTLKPIVDELLDHGSVRRGFVGIGFQDVSPGLAQQANLPVQQGVQLQVVVPGSPAERAGLRPGDVIVKIGSTDIRQSSDVPISLIGHPAGSELDVEYYRGNQQETTTVTLDPVPPA